jgi:hypothetical protein
MGANLIAIPTAHLLPILNQTTPVRRNRSRARRCPRALEYAEVASAFRPRGTSVTIRLSLLFLNVLWACRPDPTQSVNSGNLQIRWSGREPGRLAAVATAGWCAPRHVLEVRGIQGDTGVALAIYPAETLNAGVYRVVDPMRAESLTPAAAVALRWLTPKVVQGFRGESGTVKLQRSRTGQVSGEVKARARSVIDTQRVMITGSFHDLTLQLQPPRCATPAQPNPPAQAPEVVDTSVH